MWQTTLMNDDDDDVFLYQIPEGFDEFDVFTLDDFSALLLWND